ncbi:MAG: class I SAM-dependent methyltransferase [Polyangiaceae bacterium]
MQIEVATMGFFDTEEGVLEYERMAEGYDGRELIARLRRHLPEGSSVLEIGMGPGKDLDLLLESYAATGSDRSEVFLDRYRSRGGSAEVLMLDAVSLDTERHFDAIYSNKVLHHLTREELSRSLERQAEILDPGGIALHSLWYGDREEEHAGLRFVYYDERTFAAHLPDALSLVELERYTELEGGDSLVVVLKRADRPQRRA